MPAARGRYVLVRSIGVLLCLFFLLGTAAPAHAAIVVTVTSTGDVVAVDGFCTLREAIQATNGNASVNECIHDGSGGTDTIAFNIPGAAPHTIAVAALALPSVTQPVIINGATNPDFVAAPVIVVNGAGAGAGANGLDVNANDSTVRALVIQGFSATGIRLDGNNGVLEGNYIGTNAAGTAAVANDLGIIVSGDNNRIGTNIDGSNDTAERNLISGNTKNGIRTDPIAASTTIRGNYVGVDVTGAVVLANGPGQAPPEEAGILLFGTNTIIGGTVVAARNVISGNRGAGVNIQSGADGSIIQGNIIGLNAAGSTSIPNGNDGVLVNGAENTTIGGTTATAPGGACAGACNVISGNQDTGITISGLSAGTAIAGNFIGMDITGNIERGNVTDGIVLFGSDGTVVGGTTVAARNLISGNLFTGITIRATGINNVIQGNYIGTNTVGNAARSNGGAGIDIIESSANNTVGGTTGVTPGGACTGACNLIFGNDGRGVSIASAAAIGNAVLGNSIDQNGGIGIDLAANNVTPNDAGDGDAGPNTLQNFPVITSAVTGGGVTQVIGTLNSTASTNGFRVELFSSPTCDGSGNGEGLQFLGAVTVNTDAGGNAAFNVAGLPVTAPFQVVTATATNPTNNTSEFSLCRTIVAAAPGGITVNPTAGLVTTEAGGQAVFSVVLTSLPTADVTIALTSSDLTEGTVSPASLTFTSLNGTTPQNVTVTGVDDAIVDPNTAYTIITAPAVSADPAYSGVNASDVSVTNTDNETAPAVIVNPTAGLVTTEAGGQATFTVVLGSVPTANVTIALTSSNIAEGTVSPASLTFTPANALTAQTVTVTGVDDAALDGNIAYTIVTAAAASADPAYAGIDPANVAVTNLDNDSPGIFVNPTAGLVTTEGGGQATFTVVLTTIPTAIVTVALTSNNTAEGTVSPATLTFTPANALTAQTVTVTGVDDAVVDGNIAYTIVTGAAVSTDPAYSGLNPADVAVTNQDNDSPVVVPTPVTPPPPPPVADLNDPNKDKKERLTELQIRQRERSNQGGHDDDRTEGNVVAVDNEAGPPTATIANRDGLQVVVLACKGGCGRVEVGDYLEAEGVKESEVLFIAEDIHTVRPR